MREIARLFSFLRWAENHLHNIQPNHADATRGTVNGALVEGVYFARIFLDIFSGEPKPHILEELSLEPLLHSQIAPWRDYAVSGYEYSTRQTRLELKLDQADARLLMVFDGRWKYIHAEGFRPLLFDLMTDPDELVDLGGEPVHEEVQARLNEALFAWARRHHSRITRTPQQVDHMVQMVEPPGILVGYWDENEIREAGKKTICPKVY